MYYWPIVHDETDYELCLHYQSKIGHSSLYLDETPLFLGKVIGTIDKLSEQPYEHEDTPREHKYPADEYDSENDSRHESQALCCLFRLVGNPEASRIDLMIDGWRFEELEEYKRPQKLRRKKIERNWSR